MDVPHSGNLCSGLCRAPCDHDDCWQCETVREAKAKDVAAQKAAAALKQANRERDEAKAKAAQAAQTKGGFMSQSALQEISEALGKNSQSLVDQMMKGVLASKPPLFAPPPPASGPGKRPDSIRITGVALEALAAKAGLDIRWEADGSATFMEPHVTDEELLKSSGASEADIEAAKKLAKWKAPDEGSAKPELQSYLDNLNREMVAVSGLNDLLDPSRLQTMAQLKAAMANLKTAAPQVTTAIVHPTTYERLKDWLK